MYAFTMYVDRETSYEDISAILGSIKADNQVVLCKEHYNKNSLANTLYCMCTYTYTHGYCANSLILFRETCIQ